LYIGVQKEYVLTIATGVTPLAFGRHDVLASTTRVIICCGVARAVLTFKHDLSTAERTYRTTAVHSCSGRCSRGL